MFVSSSVIPIGKISEAMTNVQYALSSSKWDDPVYYSYSSFVHECSQAVSDIEGMNSSIVSILDDLKNLNVEAILETASKTLDSGRNRL